MCSLSDEFLLAAATDYSHDSLPLVISQVNSPSTVRRVCLWLWQYVLLQDLGHHPSWVQSVQSIQGKKRQTISMQFYQIDDSFIKSILFLHYRTLNYQSVSFFLYILSINYQSTTCTSLYFPNGQSISQI